MKVKPSDKPAHCFALCLSRHVTSFYNFWDMLISSCFTVGIDFQMMTLFLVKSPLVSRYVYTCEIVCHISRITVSNTYFLFKALCKASRLILNGIRHSSSGKKHFSCCHEWLCKHWRLMGAHLGPSIANLTFVTLNFKTKLCCLHSYEHKGD